VVCAYKTGGFKDSDFGARKGLAN